MYYYWGYGLNIESEIEFPELLPYSFESPDCRICLGKSPEKLMGNDVVERFRASISPTEYLLSIPTIANYYVAHGTTIVVEPAPLVDEKSVRLFLLSNAMAAVLHQRNMIPMHASAIHYDGGIAMFCGPSGAGKSTTAVMLQQQGFKIFSDDVCVLRHSASGQIEALPSYPMIKLWQDSFDKAGIEMALEADKIRPQLPKYARFFHQDFDITPKAVKVLFLLHKSKHSNTPGITKLGALAAFKQIQDNSYRSVQMNAMKKRNSHFDMISRLTTSTSVYNITRPENVNSLHQLMDILTPYINKA